MLQQLEGAGLLQRESDGRHYSTAVRLRRLAEALLLNDSHHGARHAVLRHLVEGSGRELQHHGAVGQRSGLPRPRRDAGAAALLPAPRLARAGALLGERKVFLAQMAREQRRRLLAHAPLERCTPGTITDLTSSSAS
jgi:DNA-binding IclR family transcriptional regulator